MTITWTSLSASTYEDLRYQVKRLFEGAASNPKCNTLPQVRCPDANQNFVPTASAG
jgi:hypothetical protein